MILYILLTASLFIVKLNIRLWSMIHIDKDYHCFCVSAFSEISTFSYLPFLSSFSFTPLSCFAFLPYFPSFIFSSFPSLPYLAGFSPFPSCSPFPYLPSFFFSNFLCIFLGNSLGSIYLFCSVILWYQVLKIPYFFLYSSPYIWDKTGAIVAAIAKSAIERDSPIINFLFLRCLLRWVKNFSASSVTF